MPDETIGSHSPRRSLPRARSLFRARARTSANERERASSALSGSLVSLARSCRLKCREVFIDSGDHRGRVKSIWFGPPVNRAATFPTVSLSRVCPRFSSGHCPRSPLFSRHHDLAAERKKNTRARWIAQPVPIGTNCLRNQGRAMAIHLPRRSAPRRGSALDKDDRGQLRGDRLNEEIDGNRLLAYRRSSRASAFTRLSVSRNAPGHRRSVDLSPVKNSPA